MRLVLPGLASQTDTAKVDKDPTKQKLQANIPDEY